MMAAVTLAARHRIPEETVARILERLRVAKLPMDTQTVKVKNPASGAEKEVKIALFRPAGEVAGARRGIFALVRVLHSDRRLQHRLQRDAETTDHPRELQLLRH